MTKDLAELHGQISLLQNELQKPIQRIKMLTVSKDMFGDDITDEEKEKHFEKAKEAYLKCKTACEKTIRDLPQPNRENIPR